MMLRTPKSASFFKKYLRAVTNTRFVSGMGDDKVIVVDRQNEYAFSLGQIQSVEAVRVGNITYDENYLILTIIGGQKISVGELTDGFSGFVQILSSKLADFPQDWSARIELAPIGIFIGLWGRHHQKGVGAIKSQE